MVEADDIDEKIVLASMLFDKGSVVLPKVGLSFVTPPGQQFQPSPLID